MENTYTLLSIYALADGDGGWTWDRWFTVDRGVPLAPDISNRALLSRLRTAGHLLEGSKGRVTVEHDGNNIVIIDRRTREPLFAFEPQWDT